MYMPWVGPVLPCSQSSAHLQCYVINGDVGTIREVSQVYVILLPLPPPCIFLGT